MGEENVMAELRKGAPGAQPTCLITCVISALNTLGVHKISVVTPYLDEINKAEEQ